jgi:hypothetical protein
MAEFLVEMYIAGTDHDGARRGRHQARRAAETMTSEGTPVTYLSSVFVPRDETCFFFFEAGSLDIVRETAHRAGLTLDHVAEMVSDSKGLFS